MRIKIFTSLVIIYTILLASSMGYAATIHVDAANQGEEDGSEAKPFNTIQEGIDAAQSGDTVQAASGIYEEADINFKDGIILQGAGAGITKITSTGDFHTIIIAANAESGKIDGFTIDGNGIVDYGFDLNRSNITITNNVITKIEYNGLYAWSSKPAISNNQFTENRETPIHLKRSDAIVTDNVIKENDGNGIHCEFRTNATITNNEISLNRGSGISMDGFSEPIIKNNQITDNGHQGISAVSASPIIEENTISGNAEDGIGGSSSDMSIRKNTITENASAGIYLESSEPTISENEISGNGAHGVWMGSNSGGSVSDNIIMDNGSDGINTSFRTMTVITDNTITGNATDGIHCDGGSPTIERNTVTDNGGTGINGSDTANPTIVTNTIAFNGEQGILLEGQAGSTITGNQIIGNAVEGITTYSTNHEDIIITGNKIAENSQSGVYILSDFVPAGVLQIRNNQISDNGGDGIENDTGSAQIHGNLITWNVRYGIGIWHEETVPDLGTDDNPGNNAIYGNGQWQLWNETPHEIQMVGNYWGAGTEDKGPKDLIGNDGGGSVIFEPWLTVEPPPPTISGALLSFIWPAHDETGSGPFQIAWKDSDASEGTLSLYYDTDRSDHDGTAILGAENISLSNTENRHIWQSSGLPQGATYYIYAQIDDGTGELSYVYSTGSVTIGGATTTTTSSYPLSLNSGLHMISLPLMPSQPYTARSFAEMLGASLVVEYDEDSDRFSSYLPAVATNDGFTIKGGYGYIINLPEAKNIIFTGTAWSAAPVHPETNGQFTLHQPNTLWAFAVGGMLPQGIEASQLMLFNPRNGWRAKAESQGAGRFGGVLVGAEGDSVVALGDTLEIHYGQHLITQHRVTSSELHLAYGIVKLSEQLPSRTHLLPNYPNPFNPETWIPYELADASEVTIRIYDIQGHLVRQLAPGYQPAGVYIDKAHAVHWDGANQHGERVSSGIYFYQLDTKTDSFIRRMSVVK